MEVGTKVALRNIDPQYMHIDEEKAEISALISK